MIGFISQIYFPSQHEFQERITPTHTCFFFLFCMENTFRYLTREVSHNQVLQIYNHCAIQHISSLYYLQTVRQPGALDLFLGSTQPIKVVSLCPITTVRWPAMLIHPRNQSLRVSCFHCSMLSLFNRYNEVPRTYLLYLLLCYIIMKF